MSQKYLHQIEVFQADAKKRDELFEDYMNPNSKVPVGFMKYSMEAFNSAFVDRNIRKAYDQKYWRKIIDFMKKASPLRAEAVFKGLMPKQLSDLEYYEEMEKLSWRFGETSTAIQKILKETYAFSKKHYDIKKQVKETFV